jgi:DNA-binding MarR family transcriptional regulator
MTRTGTRPEVEPREPALEQLATAFKGLFGAVRRLRGRDTHRPGELSFAQHHLLFGLADGELSTTQLATAADLAPATVTQMLDGLEAMGLVDRTRSSRDRRVVTCALTERGRELITSKRAVWEQRWKDAMSEFSSEELATAAAVIERMRAMYEQLDAD